MEIIIQEVVAAAMVAKATDDRTMMAKSKFSRMQSTFKTCREM